MSNNRDVIDLRDVYYMIMNKLSLLMVVTLLSAAVSGLVSVYFITPEYETFTTLMLGKPADYEENSQYTYQDVLTNQKLIGTYAEIAKSKVVMDQVLENLDLTHSTSDLRKMMSVTLLNNTEVIKITVKSTKPEEAQVITNEIAKVFFMDNVSRIMQINNVQVIDKATLPEYPVGPKVKFNIAIASTLGLIISVIVIILIEALDQTIKVPEDIEKKSLGIPVIGMIPEYIK